MKSYIFSAKENSQGTGIGKQISLHGQLFMTKVNAVRELFQIKGIREREEKI